MATEYISREAAIELLTTALDDDWEPEYAQDRLSEIPAADVVTREAFNRILAENDNMREQLAKIGKKPGDKMDDEAKVRCGEWIDVPNGSIKAWKRKCSACGMYHRGKTDFCPNCGADMRPIKEDGNV